MITKLTLEDAVLNILRLAGRRNPVDIEDLSFWLRQDKFIFLPNSLLQLLDSLQDRGYAKRNNITVTYLHAKGCVEYARDEAWQRGFYFAEQDSHLQLCCRVTDQVCHRLRVPGKSHPDHYYALLRNAGILVEEVI